MGAHIADGHMEGGRWRSEAQRGRLDLHVKARGRLDDRLALAPAFCRWLRSSLALHRDAAGTSLAPIEGSEG